MLLDDIEWLGHAGFRIRAGRAVVYIDPYRVPEGAPPADLILVTHGHYDHFSPQDVERLSTRRTWLVGPAAVAERVSGQVHSIAPGELLDDELVRGVHVAAVAAYNTSKRDAEGNLFHPREAGWVGYELNVRGERLYHSGDTDVIPEMDRRDRRGRGVAAGERHLRDDRPRGGRGGAAHPAAGGGADALGRAHRQQRRRARVRREGAGGSADSG